MKITIANKMLPLLQAAVLSSGALEQLRHKLSRSRRGDVFTSTYYKVNKREAGEHLTFPPGGGKKLK